MACISSTRGEAKPVKSAVDGEGRACRWSVLVAAVLLAAGTDAAYLRNVPQALTQPDGTTLHLYATGDEYYNRLHDAGGFTILRDPQTGYLVYAVTVNGRLRSSGLVVGRDDPVAAGLESGAMPDPRYLPDADELYPVIRRHLTVRTQGLGNASVFSEINNLVVFIRFSDEVGTFQSLETYQTWFNSTASGDSSMRRYFLEASYGRLDVSSTFYPPPNGSVMASYQDAHPRSYYRPYDAATNPDGYSADARASREWALLQAAVASVASQVPMSLNLDSDNDGFVDNVIFVISGEAVNADWGNLLWPHRWTLNYEQFPTPVNGKLVGDYNLQLDGNIGGSAVLCHEMMHTLGAPDLYHYSSCSSATGLDPVGVWDLMATTKDPPQHPTAYVKWRYLGFIPSIPPLSLPGTATLEPLTSPSNNCYRIASPNSADEYFVVEYRRRSFPFENSLPGSGVLVYRIDTGEDGKGDRCGPPDEVYVYRPDGTSTANGNLNSAFLSAGTVPPRTAINDGTNPSSFLSGGFPGGLSLHDVGTAGDTIVFTADAVPACARPGAFSLASPVNGASVPESATVTLGWSNSDGATSYDVYFGTAQDPPLLGNQTGTTVNVGVTSDTTYFWRVVARNGCNLTPAPSSGTWAFSVGSSGITLLADGFEGDLSGWSAGRTTDAGPTAWGIVSCKAAGGQAAVWCAGGGTVPQSPCTQYAPEEGAFLVAGPFSLADASDGTWDFDLWYDVDDGGNPSDPPDGVYWLWSLDGSNFSGYGTAGSGSGWEHESLRLADLQTADGTPIVGQPAVYFAFFFQSDGTTQREGAYIDNVIIKKVVGQTGLQPRRVRRHLPGR